MTCLLLISVLTVVAKAMTPCLKKRATDVASLLGVMMTIEIECVVRSQSRLGEGAVWDVLDQALWWVDIKAGLIHRYTPHDGKNDAYDFGQPVGCLARREAGGLIIATGSGLYLFDPKSGARESLVDPEAHLVGNRFNDGGTTCVADSGLARCATMAVHRAPWSLSTI